MSGKISILSGKSRKKTKLSGLLTNNIFLDRHLKTKQVLLPGQVKRKDGSWVGERQVVVSLWE